MLKSGDLVDNRYRVDDLIATGGMGDVWRATDVVLGRVVAVKVLRTGLLSDPGFAARFQGEARMMASFRHPGVVEVYDYGETETAGQHVAYLVMAYVDGQPLSARLKAHGRLDVDETMSIVRQAGLALHVAHEHGIVHRDVKPGNLLVKADGAVILVDFGVARSAAVTSVTGVNDIVGTALYMAPEQISKAAVTPATDVYALGAVAYHCLAGQPPFDGDNPMQVALRHLDEEPPPLPGDIPVPVRALVARAMAKDPEQRYPSAAAFAAAAAAAGAPEPDLSQTMLTEPRPVPTAVVERPGRPEPRRRSRRVAAAAAAAVAALVLALGALAAAIDPGTDGRGDPPTPTLTPSPTAELTTPAGELPLPVETPSAQGGPIEPELPTTAPAPASARPSPSPSPTPPATTSPAAPPPTTSPAAPPPTTSPAAPPTPTEPTPSPTPDPDQQG